MGMFSPQMYSNCTIHSVSQMCTCLRDSRDKTHETEKDKSRIATTQPSVAHIYDIYHVEVTRTRSLRVTYNRNAASHHLVLSIRLQVNQKYMLRSRAK